MIDFVSNLHSSPVANCPKLFVARTCIATKLTLLTPNYIHSGEKSKYQCLHAVTIISWLEYELVNTGTSPLCQRLVLLSENTTQYQKGAHSSNRLLLLLSNR